MKNLIFPIAIEPGDTHHAFGVVVPDIPGCHSAGDSLEEAYANAKEAIEAHLDTLLDEGLPIPERLKQRYEKFRAMGQFFEKARVEGDEVPRAAA